MSNRKFRVYARILGYVLPESETIIGDCTIRHMSLAEQKRRGFMAYQGRLIIEDSLPSFLTFPRGIDSRVFKTNYVIYTDIEYNAGSNAAVGIANDRFELAVGSLTLVGTVWSKNKYNRWLSSITYDYQICRVYELVNDQEKPIEMEHLPSGVWMCSYPAFKDFAEFDGSILDFITQTKNPVFLKALRYLTTSERGINFQYPAEKIFLDYFKCIEIIIEHVGSLRKNVPRIFRKRLIRATKKLFLEPHEVELIKKYYTLRNRGDFAHASENARSIQFMPQFPRPSDSELFNYDELRMLARRILLRFYNYINKRYRIQINPPRSYSDDEFIQIFGPREGDYYSGDYILQTGLRNKREITILAKRHLAFALKVHPSAVRLIEKKQNNLIFKSIIL